MAFPLGRARAQDLHDGHARLVRAKTQAEALAKAYDQNGRNRNDKKLCERAERVADCRNRVSHVFADVDGSVGRIITEANSCRDLLCAGCASALAKRNVFEATQVAMARMREATTGRWAFWTLTHGAVPPSQAKDAITAIIKGWTQLLRRKAYKNAIAGGSIRCLEVTYTECGLLHPHLHILVNLDGAFYDADSGLYVEADQLRADWSRMLGRQISQVHMASVGNGFGDDAAIRKTLRELLKYCFKPSSIFHQDEHGDWWADPAAVHHLATALKGRRKLSYSGRLKALRAEYRAQDPEEFEPADIGEIPTSDWPLIGAETLTWDGYQRTYRRDGV